MTGARELVARLVASNSVKPGLAADAPGEGEIASLAAARLADAGLEVRGGVPAARHRPSVRNRRCPACRGGIPTVVFGPGGAGAHAEVEWVELADVEAVAGTLVEAAGRLCG